MEVLLLTGDTGGQEDEIRNLRWVPIQYYLSCHLFLWLLLGAITSKEKASQSGCLVERSERPTQSAFQLVEPVTGTTAVD